MIGTKFFIYGEMIMQKILLCTDIVIEAIVNSSSSMSSSSINTGFNNTSARRTNNQAAKDAKRKQNQQKLINKKRILKNISLDKKQQIKRIRNVNKTVNSSLSRDKNIPPQSKAATKEANSNVRDNKIANVIKAAEIKRESEKRRFS